MPSEDSKPVKKEKSDYEDDDDFTPIAQKSSGKPHKVLKKTKKEESDSEDDDEFTPIAQKKSARSDKVQKKSTVKKEVVEKKIKVKNDEVAVTKKGKVKEEVVILEKKKRGAKETEPIGKKRERKVYDLPGQKRDPPEERDPLRIFYQTLHVQRSDSDMAAFWLMESGLLPKEEAKKVFERKQKKAQMQKLGSPMKTVTTTVNKSSTQSITVKKKVQISPESSSQKKKTPETKQIAKKRKVEDESDEGSDDDFVISKRVNKKQKAA